MPKAKKSVVVELHDQDQDERGEYLKSPHPDAWQKILQSDKERRKLVIELMEQDQLKSAEDYFCASLIMLHGTEKEEFILGHVFSMVSMSKGNKDAAWLGALTLDCIMQSLGQGQVFDSQRNDESDGISQYEEGKKTVCIPDSIKKMFNITCK
jgi:hypothetical protein